MPFCTVIGSGEFAPSGKEHKYLQYFDAYGPLLTETQQEICNLYFMCDLSLSEIAEEKGISKQAVSDTLKKSRELLDSFEEKLHFCASTEEYSLAVSDMMTKVKRTLGEFAEAHPEFSQKMGEIADMVSVGDTVVAEEEE